MNLPKFTGPTTPARRRFWDNVAGIVDSLRKLPGKNVSVTEDPTGSLIDVNPQRDNSQGGGGTGGGTGACCYDDGTCDGLSEADCTEAGGNWQGADTTCDDEGVCLGACCEGEGGTDCVPNSTPDSCTADGGTFQDFGSTCSPNPCVECTDSLTLCKCGFAAYDGSGAKYLNQTATMSHHDSHGPPFACDWTANATQTASYNTADCSSDCACSGSITRTGAAACSGSTVNGSCLSGAASPPADGASQIGTEIVGCSDSCTSCFGIICHQTALTATSATYNLDSGGIGNGSGTASFTLSTEYTTALLISNTLAAFADTCHCPEGYVVTYELNEDESCCTASCVPE